jgi:Flp pilus assembly protein TadG
VSIFEFGRAFEVWQIMTNAAREGARVAVLPGSTDTTITQRVKDYLAVGMSSTEADKATVGITSDEALGAGPGSASRVTVSYPFQFIVLQPVANLVVRGSSLGAPVTLTTSAMMRNEAP